MFSGPTPAASPAWHVRRSPNLRAASNAGAKMRMSTPSSVESAPMPMIWLALPAARSSPTRSTSSPGRPGAERPVHVGDQHGPNPGLGLGSLHALGEPGDDVAEVLA